ncbi:MAG: hypothetical protein COA79_16120 [Planctomycetota bacterium]|nr:MAG: hypothetical protein COA79_16120 [Planctomycetota bacterium]
MLLGKFFIFIVICICLSNTIFPQEVSSMKKIKNRIIKALLEKKILIPNVEKFLKTIKEDGNWADINYRSNTRSEWKTFHHMSRLKSLVLAYKSGVLSNNAKFKKAVFSGLNYWLKNDFKNPNWWWNDIGVPMTLGPILLILDDELTSAQRNKGIEILQRGKIGKTGQNLVWLAKITLNKGLLEKNTNTIKRAFSCIQKEIKLSGGEGIQYDFSFHQHGHLLYNHGYGAGFSMDCSRIAALAAGTEFAFSKEKIKIISSYILDGSQWMAFGSTPDYSAEGREISRPAQSASYLIKSGENLLKLPTGRKDEINAMMAGLKDKKKITLQGNRHFWNSDFMTHHGKGYYVSARMHSKRILSNDGVVNSEGYRSDYIADGCNYIFRTGDEYVDIFPVWNWQRIPGTTVEQKKKGAFTNNPKRNGTRFFAGGVSNGKTGLSAFNFERNGLSARKAWFFFEKEVVCLGAGITCNSKNLILTTVNQCISNGDVIISKNNNSTSKYKVGSNDVESPQFVLQDEVAYFFIGSHKVKIRNEKRKGSWHSINRPKSKEIISKKLFELSIDHGMTPKGGSYSYIICPAMNLEQAKSYNKKPTVEVLSNTPQIQAVKHLKSNLTQIAYFKPGRLTIAKELIVSVDKPCLLMAQINKNEFKLSVSDPTQKLKVIHVTVSANLTGKGTVFNPPKKTTTITIKLPAGGYAGKSVVADYKIKK